MASIRSHLISLFSGGVFPDKKWWLSCFCLPRSKETNPVRRSSRSDDKVIYTIQLNEDEEPKPEFDFVPYTEKSDSSLEKHGSDQLLSEAPLANGCQALLLERQIQTKYTRNIPSNECHEEEFTATVHEHSNADLTFLTNSEPNAEFCVLSSAKPAFIAPETESVGRSECFSDGNVNNKESCTELSSATESLLVSIVDGNVDQSQLFDFTAFTKDNAVQDTVSREKQLISEDALIPSEDFADQSFTDFSKLSSDLETSGIQSNSGNCEDTTLQLSNSYDNSYESIDDSDSNILFTNSLLTSSVTSDKSIILTHCESFKVPENQCSTPEPPECLKVENDDLLIHINEVSLQSSCLHGVDLPEPVTNSLFQPIETETSDFLPSDEPSKAPYGDDIETMLDNDDHTRMLSEVMDENLVQMSDHDYSAPLVGRQECKETESGYVDHRSHQRDPDDSNSSHSDDLDKFGTGYESVHENEMVIQMEGGEQSKDLGAPSKRSDDIFSSNSIELNVDQTENVPMKLECNDDVGKPCIASTKDDNEADSIGKINSSWNIEDLVEKDILGLSSLLQVKLLFRSDSYETFESIVKEMTLSLLNNAFDQLLLIKKMKENSFLSENSECLQSNHQQIMSHDDVVDQPIDLWSNIELPLTNERDDPFLESDSNVFEEVIIGNYEQLFDSEEWLDDDFGFSSTFFQGKPPPPYPDLVNDHPRQYSSAVLCPPDLDCDDSGVLPDFSVIQLTPEKIFPVVDRATDVFWSSRRYGEPWSEVRPPETYFSPEDHSDSLDDCSRKSHKAFLFDLVAEILQEIYSDELVEIPYPWQQVNGSRPKHTEESPNTIDVLKPVVRNRVLQSLKRRKDRSSEKMRKFTNMRRQVDNKDFVDNLLINEMYHEEPGWTDYGKDANLIKNHIANKLFFSLINETAMVLKLLRSSYATKCDD